MRSRAILHDIPVRSDDRGWKIDILQRCGPPACMRVSGSRDRLERLRRWASQRSPQPPLYQGHRGIEEWDRGPLYMASEEHPAVSGRGILPEVSVNEIDTKVLGLVPLVSCRPADW